MFVSICLTCIADACRCIVVQYYYFSMLAGYRKEFLIGTVLYKTKSLDGTKPKSNTIPNINPIQLFYAFFEHRPMVFKLASFVRFFTVPIPYSCRMVRVSISFRFSFRVSIRLSATAGEAGRSSQYAGTPGQYYRQRRWDSGVQTVRTQDTSDQGH